MAERIGVIGLGRMGWALAARLAGSESVHCYEANPALIPVIEATYALNGVSPQISNTILGAEDGQTVFYVDDDFTCSSTHDRSRGSRAIMVECMGIRFRAQPGIVRV